MAMKRIVPTGAVLLAGAVLLVCGPGAWAAESRPADRVFGRGARTWVAQGGVTNALDKPFVFAGEITVLTNAAFKIKEGRERVFKEGQTLLPGGLLLSADGSVEPAADHVTLKNGRAVAVRDGEATPVESRIALSDGAVVTAEGVHLRPGSASVRLLDGQILGLDGRYLPVWDTVLFTGGKVRGQKDGALYEVPANRSLMMNDGSKVFGDGRLVTRSGAARKLAEGEVVLIEGVARRN